MKRTLAFLLIAIAVGGSTLRTQSAKMPLPASVSADRLARIDRRLQQYVDDSQIGGAVAMVLVDGETIYERAFGWSDKEAGRRMTTSAIFRIASQTKAITSVAILALMEEGKLGVRDNVSRFIPAFAKTTVAVRKDGAVTFEPAKRQITIADLLTHTAGISYGVDRSVAALYEAKGLGPAAGYGWYTADKDEPICATMERLATLPFVAQPGEAFVYGYNTDVLG
jgi:CubicO group peptidase (beta-lactamase class C family)